MYCNLFDTVRTTNKDSRQTEGVLFNMIRSGYHPTLSINQAVDSGLISTLCSDYPDFLELFDRGIIRVALFGKNRSVIDYLDGNLKPVDGKFRNSFKFSSLPFLYKEYTDAEIQKIYNVMRGTLHGGSAWITRDLVSSDSHKELLNDHLHAIREMTFALEQNYIPPHPDRSPNLSQRIDALIRQITGSHPASVSPDILALQQAFQDIRTKADIAPDGSQDAKAGLSSRSYLYELTEDIVGKDAFQTSEAKAMIDLCYNEKVAASLKDGENDLMAADPKYSSLLQYMQDDALDNHTIHFDAADADKRRQAPTLSWEALIREFRQEDFTSPAQEGMREDPFIFTAQGAEWLRQKHAAADTGESNGTELYWQVEFSRTGAATAGQDQDAALFASLKTDYVTED